MKKPRYLNRMAKSTGTRVLALLVMLLLALEPCVFAAIIYKYPTGSPTIGSVDMDAGAGVNTLYYGSVFGFNSAKSADDVGAEIREGACVPETTSYTFLAGMDGWTGVPALNISYMYDSAIGSGAIKAVMAKRNTAATYTFEKTFFYDCSTPATVNFAMDYSKGVWTYPNATPANSNFSVILVRPDLTTKTLVATTTIANASMLPATITTQPVAADLTQVGTYTLRITGALATANTNGAKLEVAFDNITLTKTPVAAYTSFQQNVEFTIDATPVSTLGSNQYLLEIRAKKPVGDGESTIIQVCGDNLPTCGSWTNPPGYTVSSTSWTDFASHYLTTAQYNGGKVRVRYIDATAGGDDTQGGVDVDYQRVKVDTGSCVDSVTDSGADCGKCHNYGGDITKPWPDAGFHNKHAQTESISDCLWCHPSDTYAADHSNGVVEIDGTKIYKFGTAATKGGTGTYDAATTKTCTTPANGCHRGIQTPSWFSVVGVGGFYQNCARCHNSTGSAPADTSGDLHIDVAWPNDVGQGHLKHDTAFNFDTASCQASGSCHPDNRFQHTVVGDGIVEVKMASVYASPNKTPKYIPDTTNGTGTCVNMACHGGMQTPRFNLSSTNPIDVPTQCTKCHLAEKADSWGTAAGKATQWNSALSGLHRGSPPTSGKSHIADYSCTACHNNPSAHFMSGGVSNLASGAVLATDMDALIPADFKAVVGYAAGSGGASPNYTNPPTCSNPAPTTGCHAESDPANKSTTSTWARKWSWDAYDTATPLNQCKSCHGHWGNFTAGVVQPHVTSNSDTTLRNALINNHGESGNNCGTMCHGQTDAAYNHGVGMTATSKDMSLNTNAGIVKTAGPPARVGCSFCHGANDGAAQGNIPDGGGSTTNHIFAESNWLTDTANAGPAPTCYNPGASANCHGDGVYKSWPTGSPGSYPNRIGKHQIHLDRLATKLGKNLASITQTDQNTMCLYCHNTASPGLAGHTTDLVTGGANQAEITGIKRLWDATADATAPVFGYTSADGSCTGIDCHNNKATSTTYGWRSAGVSTCTMCHTRATSGNNPSSGLHYGSTAPTVTAKWHDDTLTGGCAACHTIPAYSSSSTHVNGTFSTLATTDPNATLLGLPIAASNRYTSAADNVGTCSGTWVGGANCHGGTSRSGDAGTWARKWDTAVNYATTGAECNGCHGGPDGAGWVAGVMNHDQNWNTPSDAVSDEIIGNHGGNTDQYNRCSGCHVYNDTVNNTYKVNAGSKIGWVANAGSTSTYHGNGNIDFSDQRAYNGSTWTCGQNCHTAGGSHAMADSGWTTVATVAGSPGLTCSTCHPFTTHIDADGPGGAAGDCLQCHTDHASANRTGTNGANNIYIKTTYGEVTNIGFTAPSTITGSGLSGFTSGKTIVVIGATNAANNGQFTVSSSTATTIVVSATTLVTETAAAAKKVGYPIPTMNNSYASATHNGYIQLGGTAITFGKSTEAETCWACHDALATKISEWGANNNADTGSSTYDYGKLFTDVGTVPGTETSNWYTGYWRSGKGLNSTLTTNPYWYKRGKVRSTHSANYDGTTVATGSDGTPWKAALSNTATTYSTTYNRNETLDTAANIRCSYCHDVHGTHNTVNGDNSTGQPYLRGSWIGNLYAEDGAPRWNMSIFTVQGATATTTQYGVAPRSSADPNNTGLSGVAKVGGFWIDQNSGNPTSTITGATALDKANNSSGLCEMCHGANKNGTWTAAGIGALDQITGEALWVSGLNGHNNAVIGAAGVASTAANIFTRTKRGAAAVTGLGNNSAANSSVDMGLATQTSYGVSYRQSTSETTGYRWKPWVANTTDTGTTASRAYSYRYFAWNTTNYQTAATYPRNFSAAAGTMELLVTNEPEVATETAHNSQANYHTFTCSKCHNPHASRLPKLMITNCLDTNHNTWEDKSTYTQGQGTMAGVWAGLRHSQWPSAQNCHRLDARAVQTGVTTVGTGWNKVTPWIEDTTPNPASASGKTGDITTQIAY